MSSSRTTKWTHIASGTPDEDSLHREGARRSAEIFDYISQDDLAAAKRVQRAIFDAIDLLASFPYLGISNARSRDLRSKLVSRYPYRVHYRLKGSELWVVHIRHTARRLWEGDR